MIKLKDLLFLYTGARKVSVVFSARGGCIKLIDSKHALRALPVKYLHCSVCSFRVENEYLEVCINEE